MKNVDLVLQAEAAQAEIFELCGRSDYSPVTEIILDKGHVTPELYTGDTLVAVDNHGCRGVATVKKFTESTVYLEYYPDSLVRMGDPAVTLVGAS